MATAAQNARNERARSLGYRNYYDFRVHDNGASPPGAPVTAEMRARNRGHRSAADLYRLLERTRRPRPEIVVPVGLERGPDGRYTRVQVLVLLQDGTEREFILRGEQASSANLKALRRRLETGEGIGGGAPIAFLAAPSIDVFANEEARDDIDYFEDEEAA